VATPPHHPGSDNSDTARYQRGLQAYSSQFYITPEQVPAWFADAVGDRFAEEAIQSAANAWTADELSLRDRSLIVIAALIAQGDLEAQLRMHTRWALDHGATPAELDALATPSRCVRSTSSAVYRISHALVPQPGNGHPAGPTTIDVGQTLSCRQVEP